MWVKFTDKFQFIASPQVTLGYPTDWEGSVTRRCGELAIAAGKAERIPTPRRKVADGEAK